MKKIALALLVSVSSLSAQEIRWIPKASGKVSWNKTFSRTSSMFHTGSLLGRFKPARLVRSSALKTSLGLLAAGLLLPACGNDSDSDKGDAALIVENKTARETLDIWLKPSYRERVYAGTLKPGESLSYSFYVDGADYITVEANEILSKEDVHYYMQPVFLPISGASYGVKDPQETAIQIFNQRNRDVLLEMDDLDSTTMISVVAPPGSSVYPVRGDRFYSIKVTDLSSGTVLYFNPSQWFTGGQVDSPFPVVVN